MGDRFDPTDEQVHGEWRRLHPDGLEGDEFDLADQLAVVRMGLRARAKEADDLRIVRSCAQVD